MAGGLLRDREGGILRGMMGSHVRRRSVEDDLATRKSGSQGNAMEREGSLHRTNRVGALVAAVTAAWIGCAPKPSVQVEQGPQVAQSGEQASDIDYAQTYMNLGVEFYNAGRYADAIDQYRLTLEINPYLDEAHASMGVAQYKLGKKDLAEASFRRALRLNPRNTLARNGLALVSDDEQERAKQLEAAVSYNPDVPELRNNLCYTYAQTGDYERAVGECRESLRIDSANAHAHYNLGYAYQRQGRLDQALSEYHLALRLDPNWARVLNNMGLVYYYKSEFSAAIERYQQAIAADGTESIFHFNLALAYEAVASRLQSRESGGGALQGIYGIDRNSDWRTLYRQAADALRAYLNMRPDAPDASRVQLKINELRRRAA